MHCRPIASFHAQLRCKKHKQELMSINLKHLHCSWQCGSVECKHSPVKCAPHMDACRALLKGNPATAKLSIPHSSLPRTIRKMPSCGENPWFDKILTNPFGVLEDTEN
jgi:hypothetical protein